MAQVHERPEFVDRKKVPNAITELLGHVPGIVRECLDCVARLPSALILQSLRQVPMVQCCERRDPGSNKLVNETIVKIEPFLIRLTSPARKDARPGDRKPIGVRPDALHQGDILLVATIVVVGDVASIAVLDVAGRVRVPVPDGLAFAVLVPRALDLVCRRGSGPVKALRKRARARLLSDGLGLRRRSLRDCRKPARRCKQRCAAGEFRELPTIEPRMHACLPVTRGRAAPPARRAEPDVERVSAQSQLCASAATGIVIRDKVARSCWVAYYCAKAGRDLGACGVISKRRSSRGA